MSSMDLMPGIVAAVDEERYQDAADLAADLLASVDGNATLAIVHMATFAKTLHRLPAMSLQAIANMQGIGEVDATGMRDGDFGVDLVSCLEDYEDGQFGPDAAAIIDRYNYRPGSAVMMQIMATTAALLLADVEFQMIAPMRRSPAAARRFAYANARSVLAGDGALNPLEARWKDEDSAF